MKAVASRSARGFAALAALAFFHVCAGEARGDATADSVGELVLARRGGPPEYVVVVRERASASELAAAAELTNTVHRQTGVALPVETRGDALPAKAIILRGSPRPDPVLGEDGFRITARPPHLLIEGSAASGVLYGVYDLLESFGGVGWYASWMTVVPERDSFAVPANLAKADRPAFEMRECCYGDAREGAFAAHLRLNGEHHALGEGQGGCSRHRYVSGLGKCHTLPSLVPAGEFFDGHPEYFALVDGRRVSDGQVCLTNPDVRRIVVERVLERCRADPGAAYCGVSLADTLGWCECGGCTAAYERTGALSGPLVELVNEVAEAVGREFPRMTVETLAYRHTRRPPNVRPAENVIVCFCTFFCDFRDPLLGSRNAMSRETVADLVGWRRLTGRILVWDYPLNYFHHLMPYPNTLAFAENVGLYRRVGVSQVLELGGDRASDFAPLKCWILAKLLWNPDADVPSLLDRFFAGFYGPAAPWARRYFDSLHALARDTETMPLTFYEDVDGGNLTETFLEDSVRLLMDAERAALAAGDAARAANVRLTRLSPVYTLLLKRARRGESGPSGGDLSNAALLAEFERGLAEFAPVSLADWKKVSEPNLAAIRALAPSGAVPKRTRRHSRLFRRLGRGMRHRP